MALRPQGDEARAASEETEMSKPAKAREVRVKMWAIKAVTGVYRSGLDALKQKLEAGG